MSSPGTARSYEGVSGASAARLLVCGSGVDSTCQRIGPEIPATAEPCRYCWKRALADCRARLSGRGFRVSVLPATLWSGLYFAFVVHVRLSLDGWPRFGQQLEGTLLRWHEATVWQLGRGLFLTLYALPIAVVVLPTLPRWRHWVVYLLTYAGAFAAVYGLVFLAPGPFLNWFLD